MKPNTAKASPPPQAPTHAGKVGYGRPPKEHQFKPGQSGNPRGRRKNTKNYATIVEEILQRKLSITDRGKARIVPLIEAMLLKFAEVALRGNHKAAAFLLKPNGAADQNDISPIDVSQDDQELLDAFIHRIKAQAKNEGE